MHRRGLFAFLACTTLLSGFGLGTASADGVISGSGISHLGEFDRRPLMPIRPNGGSLSESFDVLIQAFRFDLTSAEVVYDIGSGDTVAPTSFIRDKGAYAVFSGTIPATTADIVSYYFILRDGSTTRYWGPDGISDTAPSNRFIVNFVTLEHAPLGPTPTSDGGAVFRVWAPGRTSVHVRGGFNNWSTTANPLTEIANGEWIGYAANVTAGDKFDAGANYKYRFQPGNVDKSDPRSRALNNLNSLNSVVTDPLAYQWQSDDFATPAWEDMMVYQVHVGMFPGGPADPFGFTSNPGQYSDLTERADYIASLGVNMVMLMPIHEFGWDWSGGYNPVSQFAIESAHGSPDDLKEFIDAMNQRGIGVMLDIVQNHNGSGDNFMWDYLGPGNQLWFDDPAVETPWGPQLDFDRFEVRKYMVDSVLTMLEEFRFSGFRWDATQFMSPYQGTGYDIMRWANDAIDQRFADTIQVAEHLPNDPVMTRATSDNFGAGFDSQYHLQFREAMRSAVFDAAFGDPNMSRVASATFATETGFTPVQRFNYIELHDEVWPTSGGQRMVITIDPDAPHNSEWARGRTTAAQGYMFMAPGIPAIHQGTEFLESRNFGSGGPSDTSPRLDWRNLEDNYGVLQYYKDLIAVRAASPALRANAGARIFHVNEGGNVLGMHRWDGAGEDIIVILNMSNNTYNGYQIGAPVGGTWYQLLNSEATGYQGLNPCGPDTVEANLGGLHSFSQSLRIDLPKHSLVVLRAGGTYDFLDIDNDGVRNACDNCPFVANFNQSDSDFVAFERTNLGDACDCNFNARFDDLELAEGGTDIDFNQNGVIDTCEGFVLRKGDLNCDGALNTSDIDPFVFLLLNGVVAYGQEYPNCDYLLGDMNNNGSVTTSDIDGFVDALLDGF